MNLPAHLVGILVQMVDAVGREDRGSPDDAVHLVPVAEEQLQQVRSILASDTGDQRTSLSHQRSFACREGGRKRPVYRPF